MTHGCKIDEQDSAYFLTFTGVEWVNVIASDEYKIELCNSLNYCTDNKALEIYAYVIMNTHMHLLAASNKNNLSDIVRDFKKYTSSTIISSLEKENTNILNIFITTRLKLA